ncbi:hypothetical protein FACS1894137_17220 [Spirochaetia bacterium]|nr:hypothetical protein FACS1894137_17220 [Spirochaetia bacterium]
MGEQIPHTPSLTAPRGAVLNRIGFANDEHFNPILETVAYKCKSCGGLMKNYDKSSMIPKGE